MSRHNLCSPSNTYLVLPTVTVLNKDSAQSAKPYQLKNPIIFTKTSGTAHNDSRFTRNSTQNIPTIRNLHNPPVIIEGNYMNRTTNIISKVVEDVTNKTPAQNTVQENSRTTLGAVESELPSTSTQSNAPNNEVRNGEKTVASHATSSKACETNKHISDSDSESTTSSSSSKEGGLRKIDFLRLPYSSAEDIEIVKYILMGDNVFRTGSLSLWKELERRKKNPKRTYQSLKNRFLRNIKPHLLTRYSNLVVGEALNKVIQKFPELKKVSKRNKINIERNVTRRPHQTETFRRSMAASNQSEEINGTFRRNKRPTREVETNTTNIDESVQGKVKKKAVVNHEQNASSGKFPGIEEVEKEKTDIVPFSESGNVETSTAVELYVPGKTRNLPMQSFQCSKIIKTLQNKTNLNLNIVLLNDQSASLLSSLTGPVKVDVIVSLSSLKENDVQEANLRSYQLEDVPSTQPVTKKVKKPLKKPLEKRPARGRFKYVLQLKKCNRKKNKKLTVRGLSKGTLADLIKKIAKSQTKNVKESALKRSETGNVGGMLLRSQVRQPIADFVPVEQSNSTCSEETNCSVDDESDYSQVYREVSKTYRIITVSDDGRSPIEEDDGEIGSNPRKRLKKAENPTKNNILLKNMVGMLSPSSKVFTGERGAGRNVSKKL